MRMLKNAFIRARQVLRSEGPLSLARRTAAYVRLRSRRLYFKRDCYLYRHHVIARESARYLPRLDSYELRILESEEQADELAAEGYEDFRLRFLASSRNLLLGAVGVLVFVDKKIVHMGWVAMDFRAQPCADPLPLRVAFDDGEACTGGTYTVPEYRGKGLMGYGYYERFEYLRSKGYKFTRNTVETHNVASQRVHAKFSPEVLGTGHFIRVLWWSRWVEHPFPDGPHIGMPPAVTR